MGKLFTPAEDDFLRETIDDCYTLYELVERFNANFPEHPIKYSNLGKRLALLGIKKGTHNIRKGVMPSKNAIETVIWDGEHGARVKTESGYVAANAYFKRKYFGKDAKGILVNLNGNRLDFSPENIMLVSKSIHSALCWRRWFFRDPELTRAAIMTAELLSYFPDLIHNENQYYKMQRSN